MKTHKIIKIENETPISEEILRNPELFGKWFTYSIFQARIFVDLGINEKVQIGDYLISISQIEVIKDLDGKELGRKIEEDGNRLKVIEIFENYCICQIDSFAYEEYFAKQFINKLPKNKEYLEITDVDNLFPVTKGQGLFRVSKEESFLWEKIDDIYGRTLSNDEPVNKEILYKELIKETDRYLIKYNIGSGFFIDQVIFQKGFALHKVEKYEESTDTFNLYIDYFPNGKSLKGVNDWISKNTFLIDKNRIAMNKKIILFLGANPLNTTKLRIDKEISEIDTQLRLAKMRDSFELRQKWAVTPDALQQALLDYSPDIVHFSGHGETEGIAIEDINGNPKMISNDALADTFRILADNIECVVLNSCYSKEQAVEIVNHIPNVIGMKRSVPDDAAIKFSVGFYKGIGAGRKINTSFELGVNAIKLEGISGSEIPELIQKES